MDKKTGTIHTILNVVNGVALTDNIEKIPVTRLMDHNLYSQYKENIINESKANVNSKPISDVVDPNAFFNSAGTYNTFAEKIRNIDTSKIPDEQSTVVSIPVRDLQVDNSVNSVYSSSVDDEMAEVAKKYGVGMANQQSVQKQNEAFAKYLGEDEGPVVRVDADTHEIVKPDLINQYTNNNVVDNPVHAVFRQAKRSLPFQAIITQDGNLPRLDFIEMMEDSYEVSIIDFLADDYVDKLLSNPAKLKNQIKEQIIALLDKKNGVKKSKPKVEVKKEKLINKRVPVVPLEETEKIQDVVEKPKRSPRKNKIQS